MSLNKLITKGVVVALSLVLIGYSGVGAARFLQPDPVGVDEHVERHKQIMRSPAPSSEKPPLEINPFARVANNPLRWTDPTGEAICFYDLSTGRMTCAKNGSPTFMPMGQFASGNNSIAGCKNNAACASKSNVGPIPPGCYTWTGSGSSSDRRNLTPTRSTNAQGRSALQTHQCAYPFGPAKTEPFCSKGCVTSTSDTIEKLNNLIDSELGSMLCVMP